MTVISSSANPPTFNSIPNNVRIEENREQQDFVTSISAVPSVTNTPITYSIVGGNIGQAFGMDSSSGRIFVSGTVDYEITQEFHLWIEALQAGTTPVSNYGKVDIVVEDMNDNAPRFSQPFYNMSIMENFPLGSPLESVSATDLDSGDNGKVKYSLAGADSSKFKIDPLTGQIMTFTSLDRETLDTYSLIVVATDQVSFNLSFR